MTVKPAAFNVQVFIPELPKPEGELLFRSLLAPDSADAIQQALKSALPNGSRFHPKRLFVLLECMDGDERG